MQGMGCCTVFRRACNVLRRSKLYLCFSIFFVGLCVVQGLEEQLHQRANCAVVAMLIASLWCTQAVPVAATSLLPLVLFPLLGVQHGRDVAKSYFNSTLWVFIGSFLLAEAVEKVELHRRVSVGLLRKIGLRPRFLLAGFMGLSAGLSTLISNTATSLMMVPIASVMVKKMRTARGADGLGIDLDRLNSALVLGTAYACNVGGVMTLTGTGPNLVLAGQPILQVEEGEQSPVTYARWFTFAFPLGLTILCVVYAVLCFKYVAAPIGPSRKSWTEKCMRWRRSAQDSQLVDNSGDAHPTADEARDIELVGPSQVESGAVDQGELGQARELELGEVNQVDVGGQEEEGEEVDVLETEWRQLGPMTFSQKVVCADLLVMLVLMFFREPDGFDGWSKILPRPSYAGDATTAMTCAVFLFFVPVTEDGRWAGPSFRRFPFTAYPGGNMTTHPKRLRILDETVLQQVNWSIVLLLGGGFALSSGFKASGLSESIAEGLCSLVSLPTTLLVIAVSLVVAFFTELNSNVSSANIFLPIVGDLALAAGANPLLFLVPATISCSFAFMLPVATPPNAVAFSTGMIKASEMMQVGLALNLISVGVLILFITTYGEVIYHVWDTDTALSANNNVTCG